MDEERKQKVEEKKRVDEEWCEVCLRYFTKSLGTMVFMQAVYSTVVRGNSNWVCDKG